MTDGTLRKGLPVVMYGGARKTQVQLWVAEAQKCIEFLYDNEATQLSELASDLVQVSHDMARAYTTAASATTERTACNKFFHLLHLGEGFVQASEQVTQTETSDKTRLHPASHL
jgi:hypothetical protein